jgi:hypothetical protein
MDDIKEELVFIINTKINVANTKTRIILNKFSFLNHMLLNRLTHYKIDELKIDKLIDVLNSIDQVIHSKVFGFTINIDNKNNVAKLSYLGQL